jgi:two-component system LytT family sensor kinase
MTEAANCVPPNIQPRVDRRVALLSIVGFWVFYYILNSCRFALLDWDNQWQMLQARTGVSLIGILLFYCAYLAMRRVEGRAMPVLVATAFLAAVPVAVVYAFINYTAFSMITPMDNVPSEHESKSVLIAVSDLALSWYFFIVAWSALFVALSYAARVKAAERNIAFYRAEAQNAQLRALRYQINPHFLFNTLNSLSTLILRRRSDEAERMVINLAAFFRASLTGDPTADVTLAEEIRMQRLYLEIEESRFPDRLKVQVEVPSDLEQALIPGFILQPLVENAIKYAVARSLRPVTIQIRAEKVGDRLVLSVEDDGDPMLPLAANGGTGVGLRNVRDRLLARYGEAADCSFWRRDEGGFRVQLTMPLVLERALAAS